MLKPAFKLLLALMALLLVGRSPLRAAKEKSKLDEATLEKQLQTAEKQLRVAARQIAELRRQDAGVKRVNIEKIQRIADHAARDARREVRVVRKIRKGEPRARLGVRVEDYNDGKGAVIRAVEPGSPADESGLKAGDVITGVNGSPLAGKVDDEDDSPAERLAELGREFKAGAPVTLDYLRDGSAHTATVNPKVLPGGETRRIIIRRGDDGNEEQEIELPEMPEMPEMPDMPEMPRMHHGGKHGFMMMRGNMDGLELMNLQGDLGDYFGVHEGLLVLRVAPKSDLGLKAGDVILKVDGKTAAGPHDVMHALHHGKAGETIALEIQRHQLRQSLTVKRPAHEMDRDEDFDFDFETPEPPEVPETPDAPRPPRAPKAPRPPPTPSR